MNYFIYQIPGQLKSECLKSDQSFSTINDSFRHGEYGLRQVSQREYASEVNYNSSKKNPWNR